MTVLDVDPGSGWYTELLAPALAKRGKYLTTGTKVLLDRHAESHWSTVATRALQAFLRQAPELYGGVQMIVMDYEAPKLDLDGTVDMVLMMREVHMMRNWDTLGTWLKEAFRALRPGGILGIEDHRAAPGAAPEQCATTGYLPEAWVIAQVEAAGFKLAGRSEVNANPNDIKDYEKGVWTLPPEFALADKDHARYAAIGESDRMTLKFVKPE
jgi:predicted methyltransferase